MIDTILSLLGICLSLYLQLTIIQRWPRMSGERMSQFILVSVESTSPIQSPKWQIIHYQMKIHSATQLLKRQKCLDDEAGLQSDGRLVTGRAHCLRHQNHRPVVSVVSLGITERPAVVCRFWRVTQLDQELFNCYACLWEFVLSLHSNFKRLLLVVIRLTCSRAIARDLRETRIYTVNTALENEDKNHPPTNTAYVLQYSDTRAR